MLASHLRDSRQRMNRFRPPHTHTHSSQETGEERCSFFFSLLPSSNIHTRVLDRERGKRKKAGGGSVYSSSYERKEGNVRANVHSRFGDITFL